MKNEKERLAVMHRVLGGVLTGVGVPAVILGLCAVIPGAFGICPDYNRTFIMIGVASMAVGVCLCFADWFVDHKNK